MEIDIEKLIKEAIEARERVYCPYSNFAVGAALLVGSGEIYRGCNAENASYPAGICAERCAMFKAVSEGVRRGDLKALYVMVGSGRIGMPCFMCRQVISEFFDPDADIYCCATGGEYEVYKVSELCPKPIGDEDLK